MKVRRFLATLVMVSLLATVLGACGSKTEDTGEGNPRATATSTPTPTPTPTEFPKSPEELDVDTISRLFDAAARAVEDPDSKLTEGTRFLLKFEEDHISTELEADAGGFERRIWESWIRDAGLTGATYTLQSKAYQEGCTYGTVIGVLYADRKVRWTVDNLSDDFFTALAALGAEKSPAYLERLALAEKIKGDWHGIMSFTLEDIIEDFITDDDPNGRDFYYNLFRHLKRYGFSGTIDLTLDVTIRNEKELYVTELADLDGLLGAIHNATSNESRMLQFLCIAGNVDERSLKAGLRQQNLDVMTFGNSVVRYLETEFKKLNGYEDTCSYTTSGDDIFFIPGNLTDKLTYNRADDTLIYSESGYRYTLKRK